MDVLPRAVPAPEPKVMVDDLPGGKVMGQQAPGTPTTQDRKDAIEELALGVLSRSPAPLGRGHLGFDEGPFFVG
jgi:hypothetical protein